MAILTAEVIGKLDGKGDADTLVYAPMGGDCTYQKTRVYSIDYNGASNDAEQFVMGTLVDGYAEEVSFTGEPAIENYAFFIDYGMKPGALDLEKEAIMSSHRGARDRSIDISSLKITQRVYIFSGGEVAPNRFIRDICNSAIHVWSVTEANDRDVA
ncbi:MAG: hypothetical protein GY899_15320 [Verrucomicrobiaceae bacterium]|nr:hypothetical protein [Verrucomicrobiaceae bacterium]